MNQEYVDFLVSGVRGWLEMQGLERAAAYWFSYFVLGLGVALAALIVNALAKFVLLRVINFVIHRTPTSWDDALVKHRVFTRLSHLAPAMIIYYTADLFPRLTESLHRLSLIYFMIIGYWVVSAFLNAVLSIYASFEISRERPIKGYAQIVKIVLGVLVLILAVAIVMEQPIGWLLSGIGAMTAVILLIFRDAILGLVAGFQLSVQDMLRIGDWIEMPKYGADGEVMDVTLTTVKVRNWDKTITTIPAYALISDSFKNWRGMAESGGRRIKRAITIDMRSIRFCTDDELDRFEQIYLIADYVRTRREEIAEHNRQTGADLSIEINGRRMTNVGTFRAYLGAYLRNHPKIHKELTFLVRHLEPSEHGLPIEIYVFSTDQAWANYESIQADIFDHVLAALPRFGLRVFQNPSSGDIRELADTLQIGRPQ